jgi:hypothetical protein
LYADGPGDLQVWKRVFLARPAALSLPETKGKTLEEIEAHFEGKASA